MNTEKFNIFKDYPDAVDIAGTYRQHAYKLIKSGQSSCGQKWEIPYIIAKVNIIKYLLNEGRK